MAGTIVADNIQAAATSTLVLKNGVANTPPTIQDSAGTEIGTFCRAWVNFNGTTNTGGFCTIRASFNVTSVADNGTGDYTVNFTNAMPDADYAPCGTTGSTSANNVFVAGANAAPTTTAYRFNTRTTANTNGDVTYANIAIFR
jgi:hypothetical protein